MLNRVQSAENLFAEVLRSLESQVSIDSLAESAWALPHGTRVFATYRGVSLDELDLPRLEREFLKFLRAASSELSFDIFSRLVSEGGVVSGIEIQIGAKIEH